MFTSIILAALFKAGQTHSYLSFVGQDLTEVNRFMNYIKLIYSTDSTARVGGHEELVCMCSDEQRALLIASYDKEYGVNMLKKNADGFLIKAFTKTSSTNSVPKTVDAMLAGISEKSLLYSGIRKSLDRNDCLSTDMVELIEYSMRPIFLATGKRGEGVEGQLTVVRNGKKVVITFTDER